MTKTGTTLGAIVLVVGTLILPVPSAAEIGHGPQITDPAGDTVDVFTGEHVHEPDLDLRAVRFMEGYHEFTIRIRVVDLSENSLATYRTGVVSHSWNVAWTVGGTSFEAHAGRDAAGGEFAAISPGGANTDDGTATLSFNVAEDKITMTFPRSIDATLTGPGYDFADGTTFHSPTAATFEGLAPGSTRFGCGPCRQLDAAGPGTDFTFGSD